MTRLYIFLIFSIFCSCKAVVTGAYGLNRERSFSSRDEYKRYIEETYHVAPGQLYVADSAGYDQFLYALIASKADYFGGIFINDSQQLKKSPFLQQNESCLARVLKEVKSAGQATPLLEKSELLDRCVFRNMQSGAPLSVGQDGKKAVVLLLSYKTGSIHQNAFTEVREALAAIPGYRLVVLSLDPVYALPSSAGPASR